jgi:cell division septation protein DedD
MSKRVKDEGPPGTSPLYAMGDKPQNKSETFLDSLNRGREISPTDKDFSPIIVESTATPASASAVPQAAPGATEVPNGFRVQVIASSQIEKVRAEQKSLESRVSFPLYIIVTPPYYKLLAGDFVKRNEADAAAAKLKDLGYADAWVVRSKIWTSR